MSHVIMFDTLEYTKSLEESGMPEKQAEALARANKIAFERLIENDIATKQDIMHFGSKMESVRSELREDIAHLENKLTMRMFALSGIIIGSLTFIMATMKFLG